jgi:hypothetical protein
MKKIHGISGRIGTSDLDPSQVKGLMVANAALKN